MLLRDIERILPRTRILVDLRSGPPTASKSQDEVLLLLEAAAVSHLLHRQVFPVKQLLCLQHAPFDDHRAQVHAREHLECIVQQPMFYVEQQGDVAGPLCLGLANSF